MNFVSNLSIRQTLAGVICLLSIVIAVLCGHEVWTSARHYAGAQEVTRLAGLNKNLFDALGSFRLERASIQSALILPADRAQGSIETITLRRKIVDDAMTAAAAVFANGGSSEIRTIASQVTAGFEEIRTLRATAESEIRLPVGSRNKTLPDTVVSVGEKFLKTLESASLVVDGEIRGMNPALSDLIIVRSLAWNARSAAGSSGLMISTLTLQARPLEGKEAATLAAHDTRALTYWTAVKDVAGSPKAPQALRDAVAKADTTYFSGPLKEMKDAVVQLVSTGNKPNIGVDQWRNGIVPGLETIAAVASTAIDVLVQSANAAAGAALGTLASFAATLLFALLLGIAGYMLVRSRVTAPIDDMTGVMTALAAGDHSVDVPHAGRKDEIGQMAGALSVFKESLAKMAELERHERAEAAARAERAESMVAVVNDVGAVVSAAAQGDFSARLQIDHPDPQMQKLVDGINEINGVIDRATTEFADVMGAVAAGDLTRSIATSHRGRLADLAGAINDTVARLSQTVTTIQVTSSDVGLASREIKSGADDLSQRTEQQASSLEETAATTEELAASVKASAQASRQAAAIADEAKRAAESGGAIAVKAVEAMARIENASQKISDIIRVIDDIAFQTNLLALNAAVEAARAGDAGKGFAVVASEVRTLAQRSGEAAKDISALISSSNGEVTEGVKLVRAAGESLKQILSASQKVAATIADISTAANEQSNGIDEMSQAVAHMDEMTQQNAALAEQSAASAASLTQRIGQLNDLVAAFRTGQNQGTGLGHAPVRAEPAPASEPERLRQLARAAFEQQKAMPARAPVKPAVKSATKPAAQPARRVANSRAPVDTSWEEF